MPNITDRVRLEIGGRTFRDWTKVTITRSLEEISGGFDLELFDQARADCAMPTGPAQAAREVVQQGQACTIRIDGEAVLIGHIDDAKVSWTGDAMRVNIAGRDRAGDLVDCAAAPNGPAEFRNLTLTEIAQLICTPFGITVRADTDVGAPIPVFSLDAASPPVAAPTRTPVRERAGVVMTGRARDEEVGRYRPIVQLAKTQSGGVSVQTQAEWRMRVARAKSEALSYTVLDWRAGDEQRLWRPNELVPVTDPCAGISGDMLVSSIAYSYGPEGALTKLELVGPEAFDLEPIEPRQRGRQARRSQPVLDGVANPLRAR